MSYKTWKKEFYPVPASRVKKDSAVDASILKWTGCLPKNLAKHGLTRDESTLYDDDDRDCMELQDKTCALCKHYYEFDEDTCALTCPKCPLKLATGGTCGESSDENPDGKNPYYDVVTNSKPVSSIVRALKKAKKLEEKKNKQ